MSDLAAIALGVGVGAAVFILRWTRMAEMRELREQSAMAAMELLAEKSRAAQYKRNWQATDRQRAAAEARLAYYQEAADRMLAALEQDGTIEGARAYLKWIDTL